MRFLSPEELSRPLPIAIGLGGGSGTGKTWSALRLARGMATELKGAGAPFAYVDSENRRALHYRDSFPELLSHYIDFGAEEGDELVGYPPTRWRDLFNFIDKSDAAAVVIDQGSHAWEGINGVLELQAAALARLGGGEKNSLRAWAEVKPMYRKHFVERVIRSRIPVVLCTRAKPMIPDPKNPGKNLMPSKTRRDDVPWDLASDKDLLFEMTVQVILDPAHPGCPRYQIKMPDQFKAMWPADQPISEETGRAMAAWSQDQSTAADNKALMDLARSKAREGAEVLAAWWKTTSQDQRRLLLTVSSELRETAAAADAAPKTSSDNLFDRAEETVEDDEEEEFR